MAYSFSSEVRPNLHAQQSKWLLIPESQKCSLSDLFQKWLVKF